MKRQLPALPHFARPQSYAADVAPSALDKWNPGVHAATAGDVATINVFGVVGASFWDDTGTTDATVSAALSAAGPDAAVVVNINSPGGDMFQGLTIYNLLRQHRGDVTVRVLGVAASAASVVAMAGDRVEIAPSAFLMIHNSWVYADGNRHGLRAIADTLEPFDRAMADVYAARTGEPAADMADLMDAETWIGGTAAVDMGFADGLLSAQEVVDDPTANSRAQAAHRIERAMAKAGVTRAERRRLLAEMKSGDGTPRAAETPGNDTPGAVEFGELLKLSRSLTGILP